MSRRAPSVFAIILSLAMVALPACGGDEPPEQRAFRNDNNQSPTPLTKVRTQISLKYTDGAFVVTLTASEDYCEANRTVTIYEDLAKDKKIGDIESAENGKAELEKKIVGRYYASVPTESPTTGEAAECLKKRSQTVVVKR